MFIPREVIGLLAVINGHYLYSTPHEGLVERDGGELPLIINKDDLALIFKATPKNGRVSLYRQDDGYVLSSAMSMEIKTTPINGAFPVVDKMIPERSLGRAAREVTLSVKYLNMLVNMAKKNGEESITFSPAPEKPGKNVVLIATGNVTGGIMPIS